MLVSAFDLLTDSESIPSKRQLMASLLDYMESGEFRPAVRLTLDQLGTLFFDSRVMARLGAQATVDAARPRNDAQAAIDGDPTTCWLTPVEGSGFPHHLTVTLDRETAIDGFVLMGQQQDRKRIGEIKDYSIEVEHKGGGWLEVARGVLAATREPQTLRLASQATARRIRLTAYSSHDGGRIAALAELALLARPGAVERRSESPRKPETPTLDEVENPAAAPPR